MKTVNKLVPVLIIILFLLPSGCKPKLPKVAVVPEEFPVTEIRLKGPLANPYQEVSGLAWFKDRLICLPQFTSAEDLDPGNRPALYYLEKKDILAYLEAAEFGNNPEPLEPTPIPLAIEPGLYEKIKKITGFEGFEAIGFWRSRAFITVEASPPGQMLGYLLAGEMADDLSTLTLKDTGAQNLVQLQPQAAISNACYESLLVLGDRVFVFYEANGKHVNPSPKVHVYDVNLEFIHSIAFPNIEYRITDATGPDSGNRFLCINYFWPGGNERSKYNPAEDLVAKQFKKGKTHAEAVIVERLVEFQYVENSVNTGPGPYIAMTSSEPLQFELLGPGLGHARNWEGLVRLDDRGFLVITDQHPRTILGFVKFPKTNSR